MLADASATKKADQAEGRDRKHMYMAAIPRNMMTTRTRVVGGTVTSHTDQNFTVNAAFDRLFGASPGLLRPSQLALARLNFDRMRGQFHSASR